MDPLQAARLTRQLGDLRVPTLRHWVGPLTKNDALTFASQIITDQMAPSQAAWITRKLGDLRDSAYEGVFPNRAWVRYVHIASAAHGLEGAVRAARDVVREGGIPYARLLEYCGYEGAQKLLAGDFFAMDGGGVVGFENEACWRAFRVGLGMGKEGGVGGDGGWEDVDKGGKRGIWSKVGTGLMLAGLMGLSVAINLADL